MRLLLCSTEFPPGPGGIATYCQQLASHLTEAGWQVEVVTPQAHATEIEIAEFNSSQPYGIVRQRPSHRRFGWALGRFDTLQRVAAQWNPDIIVGSGERAVWDAMIVARLVGCPYLAIGYGSEFVQGATWRRMLTRYAFVRADSVIVISRYTQGLLEAAGIDALGVELVPPGADDEVFRPGLDVTTLRERLNLPYGPVLLTVGAVKERKGHDVVIRALPKLVSEFPDLTYLIVGRPFLQPQLTVLATSLGVAKHVRFVGVVPQEELPDFYNLCDVFVMVSRRVEAGDVEGYGIAVMEAALCGKAAVVSRECGLEETVCNGQTGFLVAPEDASGTAEAIGRLFRDGDLRRRMGQAARTRAQTEGTWALRAQAFDRVLRSLQARSKVTGRLQRPRTPTLGA